MNINILGTKVHVLLVFVGALCVLLLFGCIGVISWGGWKMNQQDEAVADLRNLKTENEKSQNETKKLSSQLENLNEKLQEETEKLSKKEEILNETLQEETENLSSQLENLNEKSQNETENLSWIILLNLKFNLYPVAEHCDSKECLLCQRGWIFFSDSCYFISGSQDYLTWDQSRRFCQNKSADLIVINNQQEQEFIHYNINTDYPYWLGLHRSGSNWVWIDGRIDTLGFWNRNNNYDSYAVMYPTGNPTASWFSVPNTNSYPYPFYPLCEQKALKLSLN